MLLTVNHTTNYNYDDNLIGLMQTTKLIPSPYNGLKIIEWDVTRNSEKGGEIFKDAEQLMKIREKKPPLMIF